MVTTIWTKPSTGPYQRLGDSATEGAGTYEVYLNAKAVQETIQEIPISSAIITGYQVIITKDQQTFGYILRDMVQVRANPDTHMINFRKAQRSWSKNDTPVYLTIEDNYGNNQATWPAADLASMVQITVLVNQLVRVFDLPEHNHFHLQLTKRSRP